MGQYDMNMMYTVSLYHANKLFGRLIDFLVCRKCMQIAKSKHKKVNQNKTSKQQ